MSILQPPPWRLSFSGLLRSELRKLTSMTSTWVLLGLSVMLGLTSSWMLNSMIFGLRNFMSTGPWYSGIERLSETLFSAPVYPGAVMGLLGIMAVTNEYASGMIRTTISLVPTRWPMLTAKAVVVAGFAFATALLGSLIGALLAWPQLAGSAEFDLFKPSGLQVWVGGAFVVMLLALMGVAFGVLIRSTSGAVLVFLLGVMLVLPFFALAAVRFDEQMVILQHMPAVAAFFVYAGGIFDTTGEGVMGTLEAVATMLAWTLVPLTGAYARLMRSDA